MPVYNVKPQENGGSSGSTSLYMHTVSAYSVNSADDTEDEIIFLFYSTSNTQITTTQQVIDFFESHKVTNPYSSYTTGPTVMYIDSSSRRYYGAYESKSSDLLRFQGQYVNNVGPTYFTWHCKDDGITEYSIVDTVVQM